MKLLFIIAAQEAVSKSGQIWTKFLKILKFYLKYIHWSSVHKEKMVPSSTLKELLIPQWIRIVCISDREVLEKNKMKSDKEFAVN